DRPAHSRGRAHFQDVHFVSVLILHGTWVPDGAQADGRFFVWAERLPAGRRGPRPGRRPKEGAPHPFQARPEEVRDAIVALAPSLASPFERTPWRLARHNIRLPSSATGPIPSPDAARLAAALTE